MKTLMICLFMFCIVTVSSKSWMHRLDYPWFRGCVFGGHLRGIFVPDGRTFNAVGIQDNIMPPEIPEITPKYENDKIDKNAEN
ncbi:hypothetical protein P5V15_005213 [Pogonomyrmex californicus]